MTDETNPEPNIQPNLSNNPPIGNDNVPSIEPVIFDPYANLASGHIGISQTEKNKDVIHTSQTLLSQDIIKQPILDPVSTTPVTPLTTLSPNITPTELQPTVTPQPILPKELPEDPYLTKGIIKPPSQFQTPKPKADLFANANNTKAGATTPNWSNRSINNSHIKASGHINLSSDIPANAGLVTRIMFKTKLVKSEKDIVKVQLIIAGIFFGLSIAMLFIFIL